MYDPFSIEPDGLHITAALLTSDQQAAYHVGGFRRFGSGMLLSNFTFSYGKIRVVAKLPSARGSWPALRLIPESHQPLPEIDILQGMAWGDHALQMHSGILLPDGEHGGFSQWFDVGNNLSADFHEYGLDWTPETLTGFFDGKILWKKPTPSSLNQNMYLAINLGVGGKEPFNALAITPMNSVDYTRLMKGTEAIAKDYPAELVIKSVTINLP